MFYKREAERIMAYGVPIDMRKSFDGLIALTKRELGEDPLSGILFVFINKRRNYLKSIYWDRTGYCLFAKKLERGRFNFPNTSAKQELTEQILKLVLDGIELGKRRKVY
jgi:transposase